MREETPANTDISPTSIPFVANAWNRFDDPATVDADPVSAPDVVRARKRVAVAAAAAPVLARTPDVACVTTPGPSLHVPLDQGRSDQAIRYNTIMEVMD